MKASVELVRKSVSQIVGTRKPREHVWSSEHKIRVPKSWDADTVYKQRVPTFWDTENRVPKFRDTENSVPKFRDTDILGSVDHGNTGTES